MTRRRTPLYSRSDRSERSLETAGPVVQNAVPSKPAPEQKTPPGPGRIRTFCARHDRALLLLAGFLAGVSLLASQHFAAPKPVQITQEDIDRAVRHSLETKGIPSQAAKAYEILRPSVVRVRRLDEEEPPPEGKPDAKAARAAKQDANAGGSAPPEKKERGTERVVGTGVVIVDSGLILTNLHVVKGASRLSVMFADGLESEAFIVSTQPENDLAVIQARTLPDDLVPATLKSARDLRAGDEVIAVGYPWGLGPSVTSGVISGLKRAFLSPEGNQVMTNLIQFDAAANPGNSGGPLATSDGGVVGIVTAIANPTGQRSFAGIGFAVPIESAAAGVGLSPF
jgi:S1-C subfamily serine protease